jgi:predicted lipoprotein
MKIEKCSHDIALRDIADFVERDILKKDEVEYAVLTKTHRSSTKTGLIVKLPTDLDGRSVDPILTSYSVELKTKILTRGAASYIYFDQAKTVRE